MRRFRRILPVIILALLIAANVLVWVQRERLADWWVLRGYTPDPAVVALANQDQLTDRGRHLLYVNHPRIEGQAEFNASCTDKHEHSVVLGCYKGDRQGIHLYDVTDPRLAGVQQVTLAHEMLHQAYDRLRGDKRKQIDVWLQDYAKTVTDKVILDKLDLYRQTEPDSIVNEMHSIFGSEVAQLPADLENYYKQYFNDRAIVVAFATNYQAELTSRQKLMAEYDSQLKDLDKQIESNKQQLAILFDQLTADRKRLESLRTSSVEQFNAQVIAYNAKAQQYRDLSSKTTQVINQFNAIVVKRNDLSVEQQQLQDALDSHYISAP